MGQGYPVCVLEVHHHVQITFRSEKWEGGLPSEDVPLAEGAHAVRTAELSAKVLRHCLCCSFRYAFFANYPRQWLSPC